MLELKKLEKFELLSKAEKKYVKGYYKGSNPNYYRVLRCRVKKKLQKFQNLCFELLLQDDPDMELIFKIVSIRDELDLWIKKKYSHLLQP